MPRFHGVLLGSRAHSRHLELELGGQLRALADRSLGVELGGDIRPADDVRLNTFVPQAVFEIPHRILAGADDHVVDLE